MQIKNASVEINGGCNYVCEMCPQSTGREKSFLKKMPLTLFEEICDQLKDLGCGEIDLQGSGEPLLNRNISDYVSTAKKYSIDVNTVSNGYNLTRTLSDELIDAGINNIRVSVIGYDQKTYLQWMKKDAFHTVYENCLYFLEAAKNTTSSISSYHLIINKAQVNRDIDQYQKNWIRPLGISAEIWLMHNWAGAYDKPYNRSNQKKRSCGRPFAPYLNIRAGGLDLHHGAVVPCCYVLGNDSSAVLGHADTSRLKDILNSDAYEHLRTLHLKEEFDKLDYCKNCDQLYESPESLVWTNIHGKKYGQHKTNQSLDYLEYKEIYE